MPPAPASGAWSRLLRVLLAVPFLGLVTCAGPPNGLGGGDWLAGRGSRRDPLRPTAQRWVAWALRRPPGRIKGSLEGSFPAPPPPPPRPRWGGGCGRGSGNLHFWRTSAVGAESCLSYILAPPIDQALGKRQVGQVRSASPWPAPTPHVGRGSGSWGRPEGGPRSEGCPRRARAALRKLRLMGRLSLLPSPALCDPVDPLPLWASRPIHT